MGTGYDLIAAHYDGSDWHFVFAECALCLLQGAAHEIIVVKHGCDFRQM
jgi:hypothetical protein